MSVTLYEYGLYNTTEATPSGRHRALASVANSASSSGEERICHCLCMSMEVYSQMRGILRIE